MGRDLETFAALAADWFWETDSEHRFVYFSNRRNDTVGITSRALGLSRIEIASNATDRALWQPHLDDLAARRPFQNFTYPVQDKAGRIAWMCVSGVPFFDEQGEFLGYRGCCQDATATVEAREAVNRANIELQTANADLAATVAELTELNRSLTLEIQRRKELEEQLLRLARTDSLTGLLNRRAFLDAGRTELQRLQRMTEAPRPVIVMIDIDHFKSVNDIYGHATGDRVLEWLADCIRESIRKTDFAARLGGEEFALLLHPTQVSSCTIVLDRIAKGMDACTQALQLGDRRITMSAGVATMFAEDDTFECSLARADQALYEAKRSGRDRVEIAHELAV